MSQAEQVTEDMPAYLKDEPPATGKLIYNIHLTLSYQILLENPCSMLEETPGPK